MMYRYVARSKLLEILNVIYIQNNSGIISRLTCI